MLYHWPAVHVYLCIQIGCEKVWPTICVCVYMYVCVCVCACAVSIGVGLGMSLLVLQCVAVCCSVLQCVAVCCSVLQHSRHDFERLKVLLISFTNDVEYTRRCSVLDLHHLSRTNSQTSLRSTLQHTAAHCNTLQHTATYCNSLYQKDIPVRMKGFKYSLQQTATRDNMLQHTATRCNMLQHAATCCNMLQHAATLCTKGMCL